MRDSIGSKKFCGILFLQLTPTSTWFLLPIDSWFIFEGTNFHEKSFNTVFETSAKIKFSEFRKKDILPVVIIFVLDSCLGYPRKQLFAVEYFCKKLHHRCFRLDSKYASELSIKYFSNYSDRSTNVLKQKTNVFFDE